MKCVHFADVHAYVKHSYSHVQNTLQPHCQLMKFRIMTICVKLIGADQFGASEICVKLRTKKL